MKVAGGALSLTVGPHREQHALRHCSGDDFFFATTGEDANGLSGALFRGSPARITWLTINAWNRDQLGTLKRSEGMSRGPPSVLRAAGAGDLPRGRQAR